MGLSGQDFERDQLKNRAETGKCPIFQGFEVKFPQFVPECKNILRFTILTQNAPLQFKNRARNLKNEF